MFNELHYLVARRVLLAVVISIGLYYWSKSMKPKEDILSNSVAKAAIMELFVVPTNLGTFNSDGFFTDEEVKAKIEQADVVVRDDFERRLPWTKWNAKSKVISFHITMPTLRAKTILEGEFISDAGKVRVRIFKAQKLNYADDKKEPPLE